MPNEIQNLIGVLASARRLSNRVASLRDHLYGHRPEFAGSAPPKSFGVLNELSDQVAETQTAIFGAMADLDEIYNAFRTEPDPTASSVTPKEDYPSCGNTRNSKDLWA